MDTRPGIKLVLLAGLLGVGMAGCQRYDSDDRLHNRTNELEESLPENPGTFDRGSQSPGDTATGSEVKGPAATGDDLRGDPGIDPSRTGGTAPAGVDADRDRRMRSGSVGPEDTRMNPAEDAMRNSDGVEGQGVPAAPNTGNNPPPTDTRSDR